jgi:hypothetical protein
MTAKQAKALNKRDMRDLKRSLSAARSACLRVKSNSAYAGNLYDAAEDFLRACEAMEDETQYAS